MGRGGSTLLWSSSVTCCVAAVALWLERGSGAPPIWAQAQGNVGCVFGVLFRVHDWHCLTHCYNHQGYRIKPHGQLVLVSSTHCCAYTPSLSTSWSRTTLQGA